MSRFVRARFLYALAAVLFLWNVVSPAHAQTGPSRSTPCSATTAWNAVCVQWAAVTTYSDGVPIPAGAGITYRVEQRLGTTGEWATAASGVRELRFLVPNLAPGTHYFRVYAGLAGLESDPSNVLSKGVTTGVPSSPIITIAALIAPGDKPVVIALTTSGDGRLRCKVVVPQDPRWRDHKCEVRGG